MSSSGDEGQICENCDTDNEEAILVFNGVRPTHYVTDCRSEEPYQGQVKSEPQRIIQDYVSQETIHSSRYLDFGLESNQGMVTTINANDLEGFKLQQSRPDAQGHQIGTLVASSPGDSVATNYALFSRRYTDFLKISYSGSLSNLNEVIDGRARDSLRSAWTSLGELVRSAICLKEDIEANELTTKVMRQSGEWFISISDTLDNGAGYSSKYSQEAEFSALCRHLETNLIQRSLLTDAHDQCFTSCHKCLRNYENRLHHEELSWRLAYDLYLVLSGKDNALNFGQHWRTYLDLYVESRLKPFLPGIKREFFGRDRLVYIFERKGKKIALLPWHPFSIGSSECREAKKDIINVHRVMQTLEFCPHRFSLAPLTEAQSLQDQVRRLM